MQTSKQTLHSDLSVCKMLCTVPTFCFPLSVCHLTCHRTLVLTKTSFSSGLLKYSSETYQAHLQYLRRNMQATGMPRVSQYSSGCTVGTLWDVMLTPLGLQNICWIFLQHKSFLKSSHTSCYESNTLKSLFLKETIDSLISNKKVRCIR